MEAEVPVLPIVSLRVTLVTTIASIVTKVGAMVAATQALIVAQINTAEQTTNVITIK